MSLQLYQVDQKSFLLDFKSLSDQDEKEGGLHSVHSMASQSSTDTMGEYCYFSKQSCVFEHEIVGF